MPSFDKSGNLESFSTKKLQIPIYNTYKYKKTVKTTLYHYLQHNLYQLLKELSEKYYIKPLNLFQHFFSKNTIFEKNVKRGVKKQGSSKIMIDEPLTKILL